MGRGLEGYLRDKKLLCVLLSDEILNSDWNYLFNIYEYKDNEIIAMDYEDGLGKILENSDVIGSNYIVVNRLDLDLYRYCSRIVKHIFKTYILFEI